MIRSVMYLFNAFERRRQYRNTVHALHKLTDKELCDIGIARHEIERVARS